MRPGQRAVEPRSNAAQTCSGQTASLQRGEDRPGCTDEALPPRGVCRPMNFVVAPRRHLGRLASMLESRESTTVLSAYRLSAARHPTSRAADRHLFVQRLGRPSVGGKSSAPLPLALGTDEPPGRWEVGGGSSKGPARGLEGGAVVTGAVAVLGSRYSFLVPWHRLRQNPVDRMNLNPGKRGRDPFGALVSGNRPSRQHHGRVCALSLHSTKCWVRMEGMSGRLRRMKAAHCLAIRD